MTSVFIIVLGMIDLPYRVWRNLRGFPEPSIGSLVLAQCPSIHRVGRDGMSNSQPSAPGRGFGDRHRLTPFEALGPLDSVTNAS